MSSIPYVSDYYEALGVERDASTEDIKKAFRKAARECHPDVAKDDPDAATRFNKLRQAYETLVDPVKRNRYDRSIDRKPSSGGSGAWRPPGGFHFGGGGGPDVSGGHNDRFRGRSNDLDLEDIFGDFGGMSDFGFGTPPKPGARSTAPPPGGPPPGAPGASAGGRPEGRTASGEASQGRDISLQVDVPARVAENGGTITLHYPRLRRSDDGGGLYRYNELFDLRIAPGTQHGESVRIEKMGDAGANGGGYGDLVCDIRVVGAEPKWHRGPGSRASAGAGAKSGGPRPQPRDDTGRPQAPEDRDPRGDQDPFSAHERGPRGGRDGQRPDAPWAGSVRAEAEESRGGASSASSASSATSDDVKVVPIAISEALLGGRVEVETASGRVRVTVPPCTSSGARLRLRGKGPEGRDLYVELRIVVPKVLDEESRRLIERFAELNPDSPRD